MRKLFLKYLIKYFRVVADNYGFIIKDENDNTIISPLHDINKLLGFQNSENLGVYERWFSQESLKLSQHFVDYIKDFKVVISKTGWDAVNIETNRILDGDQVIIELEEYYPPEMCRMLYNRWKSDEIITISERIMNN